MNMKLRLQSQHNVQKLFLLSLLIISFATIPIMIANNGNFFLVGDYMTQQIPFVKECRRMLLNGSPFWSCNTFLGANFLGTYSFYNYCSPFFWPLFLLPESLIPAGMGVMFIVKHVVAALTAYLYLKKHIKKSHYCILGGLLYAFSAFSMDASFFYHFIDVIAVFPLLLYCIDEVLDNKKLPLLSLVVMLNACINYYFFFGTSVFFLIYLFFRIKFSDKKYRFKDALRCIIFYAIGCFASMFILLPSALSLLETSKATGSFSGTLLRGLGSIPQVIKLLKGIMLPSEGIMGSANGFNYSVFNSNNAFLPFFGALFVLISLRMNKRSWKSKLFRFLFILTLIPFGNGIFTFFTNISYTRWWYAFVLMEVLVSISVLEEMSSSQDYAITECKKSAKTIAIISSLVFLLPLIVKIFSAYLIGDLLVKYLPDAAINYLNTSGLSDKFNTEDLRYCIVFIIMVTISYLPLYFSIKKKWIFNNKKSLVAVTLICLATYSLYLANETNIFDNEYEKNYIGDDISVSDEISYNSRTQHNYSIANYPMVSNQPGVTVFHSFKSKATSDFCNLVGFENQLHATSKRFFDTPAIQTVLSIETVVDSNGLSKPASHYSPFGYTYDYYILDKNIEYTTKKDENNKRIETMTTACYVDEETALKIDSVTSELSPETKVNIDKACEKNKSDSVNNFNMNSKGFTAESSFNQNKLVYFSIPHDNGWKAYINGKETEILTLNGGMMGIIVPEGNTDIEFTFTTPGLMTGIYISLFTLFSLMILSIIIQRKKHSAK